MNHDEPVNRNYLKNFIPLVLIFIIVIGLTYLKQFLSGFMVREALYDFMGFFFLIFSFFKIINLNKFAEAYSMYDIIAQRTIVYAYVYPFLELMLGIFYLIRFSLKFATIMTIILMTISSIGVYKALRTKENIQCACLGAVFKLPMTYVSLFEDILMGICAIVMLVW